MLTFRRRSGVLAGVLVAGSALLSAQAVTLASAAPTAHPHGNHQAADRAGFTQYVVERPVCDAPTAPGEFTCFAMRQVVVPAGTPGAYRYTVPAGLHGPGGGYTPGALAKAYSFDPHGGRGTTVALVDWYNDPSVRKSLNHFDKHYGIPHETNKSFKIVNQRGHKKLPSNNKQTSVEIALDVEAVRGVCRKCKILLVEADQGRSDDLAKAENTAVRLGADVVSNSFGSPESKPNPYPKKVVKSFDHPNVVITVSSGDNGYNYWDLRNGDPFGSNLPHHSSFPSTLPSVVSVGGTSLKVKSNGTRKSEKVWDTDGPGDSLGNANNRPLGAAGGGCSILFKATSWQKKQPGYKAAGCHGMRLANDVSAVGDPQTGFSVYDKYGLGGWQVIGGTSLSSPVIAGMYGLVGGKPKETTPSHALYQNHNLRPNALHDVTRGGNGWCGPAGIKYCAKQAEKLGPTRNPNRLYAAKVDCSFPLGSIKRLPKHESPECNARGGYDGPTGVGTPHGLKAMHTTLPLVSFSITTPRKAHKKLKFSANIHRSMPSSKIKKKTWSFGDGTKSKKGGTVHHTYKKHGHYKVKLRVKDNRGQHVTIVKRIHVR